MAVLACAPGICLGVVLINGLMHVSLQSVCMSFTLPVTMAGDSQMIPSFLFHDFVSASAGGEDRIFRFRHWAPLKGLPLLGLLMNAPRSPRRGSYGATPVAPPQSLHAAPRCTRETNRGSFSIVVTIPDRVTHPYLTWFPCRAATSGGPPPVQKRIRSVRRIDCLCDIWEHTVCIGFVGSRAV